MTYWPSAGIDDDAWPWQPLRSSVIVMLAPEVAPLSSLVTATSAVHAVRAKQVRAEARVFTGAPFCSDRARPGGNCRRATARSARARRCATRVRSGPTIVSDLTRVAAARAARRARWGESPPHPSTPALTRNRLVDDLFEIQPAGIPVARVLAVAVHRDAERLRAADLVVTVVARAGGQRVDARE